MPIESWKDGGSSRIPEIILPSPELAIIGEDKLAGYSLNVDVMKLLDVVALLQDLPDLGLIRGQVGTIVEMYEPDV
jgi:Domain of unknown function (DUF4926)